MQFSGPGFAVSSNDKGMLQASFDAGANLLGSLPANYIKYMLAIARSVTVTEQDVGHILDWVDATDISIADHHDIPHRLAQQPSKLHRMKALERLSVAVTADTYARLRLANFMRHLPSVLAIQVGAQPLSDAQAHEFMANQRPLPDGWTGQLDNLTRSITYRKN